MVCWGSRYFFVSLDGDADEDVVLANAFVVGYGYDVVDVLRISYHEIIILMWNDS